MAEEEKAADSGGEKKSKAILFVIIGIVVVLVLLVGIVLALLMTGGHDEEEHKEEAPQQVQMQPVSQQQATKIIVGNTVSVRSTDKFAPGLIYPAEGPINFTVNLMTQTGKRYLKTSMQFELDKDEIKANATKMELDKKLPMVKDTIIEILSSKSLEDVAATKGKNRVKDEIVKRINEFLIDGQVSDVFFVEFVVS
ncbi:flagellar basal body-associated protein FliL [Helicobacter japonicus]|uniref:Flagellar protein FliL n=1 Tax=Helicobacter japonicus TaxID=425400 RepID=A0A4U8TSR6_9HELI|nr:flagellar basal body-associated protein FliL [Helicobacter japonicus]MDE7235713.1 flagellar basal body-associated protein FliL [Helicobacter japonicus]TLE03286.1 flagellar basal body-associated protein FliL [Helicobacter japonicus]